MQFISQTFWPINSIWLLRKQHGHYGHDYGQEREMCICWFFVVALLNRVTRVARRRNAKVKFCYDILKDEVTQPYPSVLDVIIH